MKKILINVHPNFSDLKSVESIAELTRKTQSAVEVLHVIEDYPQDMHEWWNVRYPLRLFEEIVSKRQEFMDIVVARLKKAGVQNVISQLRWGSELHEVSREVMEQKYELVVTTARTEGTLLRRMKGCSCLKGLCRQCPSLIWLMRNPLRLPTRRILVALKGEKGRVFADSFNSKILNTARWTAEANESEIHVVHVLSELEARAAAAQRSSVDQGEFLDELRTEISQTCDRLLGNCGQSVTVDRIHLLVGSPDVVIPKLVQQLPVDLMLIGTKARAGLKGLLKGNLAEMIMDQVDCSMLIIKPDGFVAPQMSDSGVHSMPGLEAA